MAGRSRTSRSPSPCSLPSKPGRRCWTAGSPIRWAPIGGPAW
jgi:hypothetical protein